ncbi:FRG domain-containing protein [Bacteroides acidifaciens]|uniref:FRG domain-containing protein n=1 Tax=Bacteroides acidifaciens TaxID=85831 RepID=UPI0025954512|nr:FRG domain-containing protein [Bacteroides acidifaciens]
MKLPEYRSIEEKRPKFCYVKIDTKDVLDNHLNHLLADNPHCIFRGVREARYKLFTSVQREWITNGLGRHTTINQLVDSLIGDMRQNRVLNDYFASMNIVQTDFLYLSLLQHYSAPTPLLDFTHNHRVALYFATAGLTTVYTENDLDDYFSLYYIDLDKVGPELTRMDDFLNRGLDLGKELVEELGNRYPIDKSPFDSLDQYMKWKDNLYVVPLAFVDNPKFARAVTTPYTGQTLYWSNLNITAQEGCFLLYNREDIPLEEHLDNRMVWCLDIHKSLADYVRANYLSGITHDTLFPNITQMAQEAYTRFRERL